MNISLRSAETFVVGSAHPISSNTDRKFTTDRIICYADMFMPTAERYFQYIGAELY
mgnify:CR=1 FL=1